MGKGKRKGRRKGTHGSMPALANQAPGRHPVSKGGGDNQEGHGSRQAGASQHQGDIQSQRGPARSLGAVQMAA
eukprot:6985516-Alexandrium_andersonii.AAC.1